MMKIIINNILYFNIIIKFSYGMWYEPGKHPCVLEKEKNNLTISMLLDPFEIYGHDTSDKMVHLSQYHKTMSTVTNASNQMYINQAVHVAGQYLERFTNFHIKELKMLLISLDNVLDNMFTMKDIHNSIKAERTATATNGISGPVPTEFYISQEFYCHDYVYIFASESYSDIYHMGKGPAPYCRNKEFYFLNFIHYIDEDRYVIVDNRDVSFPLDNYMNGLECNNFVCVFRFPFKKNLQNDRDVTTLPKSHIKCGTVLYKLPPIDSAQCTITSGSFILDFNIRGLNFRVRDYILLTPNGQHFYLKEKSAPIYCENHVCEWNHTNVYGGPFPTPGQPSVVKWPFMGKPTTTTTPKPTLSTEDYPGHTYNFDGCYWLFPPSYGSIAGISYQDSLSQHPARYTCHEPITEPTKKNLYWYPSWMNGPESALYKKRGDLSAGDGQMLQGSSDFYPSIISDKSFPGMAVDDEDSSSIIGFLPQLTAD